MSRIHRTQYQLENTAGCPTKTLLLSGSDGVSAPSPAIRITTGCGCYAATSPIHYTHLAASLDSTNGRPRLLRGHISRVNYL